MGIAGLHCVTVVCADAERFKNTVEVVLVGHSLIAPGILLCKCGSDLTSVPIGRHIHNERDVVAAGPHTSGEGLYLTVLFNFDASVIGMIFKGDGIKDARRVVCFGTKGTCDLFGDVHTASTLVIQNDAVSTGGHSAVDTKGRSLIAYASVVAVETDACRSNAVFSTVGSSLPRTEALRRIP